jgi:ribosomal protein S18 acetylase RimI-like enzyme
MGSSLNERYYHYRDGRRTDSDTLAALIRLAAGGTVDYLFRDLIAGMSPAQAVAHNLAQNQYPHGYGQTIVATRGETVVGMTLSFPSQYHRITAEMERYFPTERLDHMRAFFSARVEESWFLDTLGVFPDHHRQGIGSGLIQQVQSRALAEGYRQLSLIVFADNAPALALYTAQGFREVRPVPLGANKDIAHQGGCLLMVCDLEA